jgi:hypothetical protein
MHDSNMTRLEDGDWMAQHRRAEWNEVSNEWRQSAEEWERQANVEMIRTDPSISHVGPQKKKKQKHWQDKNTGKESGLTKQQTQRLIRPPTKQHQKWQPEQQELYTQINRLGLCHRSRWVVTSELVPDIADDGDESVG